jgi:hypothetical protein
LDIASSLQSVCVEGIAASDMPRHAVCSIPADRQEVP